PGTFVTLSVSAGGSRNKYSWFKNGIKISNADSQYYQIKYTDSLSSGIYVCEITNPEAPELTLYSRKYWMNGINSTAVGERTAVLPKVFELNQNFPNPFNPSTTISYALPVETRVVLKIYSVDGREVRTLVNENQSAGYRSSVWDGRDNAGQNVSTGIYLYKIQAGNQVLNRKMLLLK
ncbi:MAG: T9SS type A sorting domain-containing protein, partial [Bacillota bacterium]